MAKRITKNQPDVCPIAAVAKSLLNIVSPRKWNPIEI